MDRRLRDALDDGEGIIFLEFGQRRTQALLRQRIGHVVLHVYSLASGG